VLLLLYACLVVLLQLFGLTWSVAAAVCLSCSADAAVMSDLYSAAAAV